MTNKEAVAKLQAAGDIAIAAGCEIAKIPAIDVLAIADLLTEQEPVKPEHGFPDLKCPNCGTAFVSEIGYLLGKPIAEYYRHCPGCGRWINWNA
jgi:hypothetical protein